MSAILVISVLTLITLAYVSGISVNVSYSPDQAVLGKHPFDLKCSYAQDPNEYLTALLWQRKRSNETDFSTIATLYPPLIPLKGALQDASLAQRVTLKNPGAQEQVGHLSFNEVTCSDQATYRCVASYVGDTVRRINADVDIPVTAIAAFNANRSLPFHPNRNVQEGQTVRFNCQGDVGKGPQGNITWYYHLANAAGWTNVAGTYATAPFFHPDTCSYSLISTLQLAVDRTWNNVVVRCTAQQNTFNEAGNGWIQTNPIPVLYVPKVTQILKIPDKVTYQHGDYLTLTCIADGNPSPHVKWITPEGREIHSVQLSVPVMQAMHSGNYVCVAENIVNGANHTTNHTVSVVVGAGAQLDPVIHCYNCPRLGPNDICNTTMECQSDEQCIQRSLSDSFGPYTSLGCFSNQVCNILTSFAADSNTKCCAKDRCNKPPKPVQQQQTSTASTGSPTTTTTMPPITTVAPETRGTPMTSVTPDTTTTTDIPTSARPMDTTTAAPVQVTMATTNRSTIATTVTTDTTLVTTNPPLITTTLPAATVARTKPTTAKATKPTTAKTPKPTTAKTIKPTTTKQTMASTSASLRKIATSSQPQLTTADPGPNKNHSVTCFQCDGPPDTCEIANSPRTCSAPNNYCLNIVKNHRDGSREVNMRCGTFDDCYYDWYLGTSDRARCNSFDANFIFTESFQCTFCCTTDSCNKKLLPDHGIYHP